MREQYFRSSIRGDALDHHHILGGEIPGPEELLELELSDDLEAVVAVEPLGLQNPSPGGDDDDADADLLL